MTDMYNNITDIAGIRVGHETNLEAGTGCTVILCDTQAIGGVDVRGGAPATRETDLLHPMHLVDQVHAIVLTGGSAFGLDAASGVVRFLAEHNIGYDVGITKVPIVPAAAIFDLAFGSASVHPDADMGYRACQQASVGPLPQGNVGAGTGATVGKMLGPTLAMKGGLGSASLVMQDGTRVGAIVAVNAFGNIVDPQSQQLLAGGRLPQASDIIQDQANLLGNTTIAVVATSASLTKEEINKVAQMAHNGLARAIRPAHTFFDGDTVFALALGERGQQQTNLSTNAYQVSMIGEAAANVLAQAIVNGVLHATSLHGVPAVK